MLIYHIIIYNCVILQREGKEIYYSSATIKTFFMRYYIVK